ncbi:MAG: M48 family metallopeptidase [Alphaproteobacteria bacterium]|nr:M48 family metallopeptidase [Alphaproteobacteria bacterium]MBR1600733.1 M48 family metallopeptidase [Alphaproteobacteria bacterium]
MRITLLTGKTFDISAEVGMDIKVIRSDKSGKLILRIDTKERIPVLSVPRFCSQRRAVKFVNENMDWILKSLADLPEIKKFSDGETISLFGQNVVISHRPQTKGGVWLENNLLCVSGDAEFLHRRVRDYIRRRAGDEFYTRSKVLAEKIGCQLNGVVIKDTKSRWGSCSSLNNINYSWRIALAPDFVIDYLMAHEVSHLKHRDHSDAFWKCVATLCPEWSRGNSWLRRNGKSLYAYL